MNARSCNIYKNFFVVVVIGKQLKTKRPCNYRNNALSSGTFSAMQETVQMN